MPKFVLIDPSLQAVGGHHFEYALHVLRTAEQAGFEPWLASHRKFRDQAEMPESWRILPLYQRGTYRKRRILADGGSPADRPSRRWAVRWVAEWWNDRRRAKRSSDICPRHGGALSASCVGAGRSGVSSTVSELELLGLAQFLACDDRSGGVDWHFQFHFPIYAGYEPDYPSQDANLEGLRRGFRQASAWPPTIDCTFTRRPTDWPCSTIGLASLRFRRCHIPAIRRCCRAAAGADPWRPLAGHLSRRCPPRKGISSVAANHRPGVGRLRCDGSGPVRDPIRLPLFPAAAGKQCHATESRVALGDCLPSKSR